MLLESLSLRARIYLTHSRIEITSSPHQAFRWCSEWSCRSLDPWSFMPRLASCFRTWIHSEDDWAWTSWDQSQLRMTFLASFQPGSWLSTSAMWASCLWILNNKSWELNTKSIILTGKLRELEQLLFPFLTDLDSVVFIVGSLSWNSGLFGIHDNPHGFIRK